MKPNFIDPAEKYPDIYSNAVAEATTILAPNLAVLPDPESFLGPEEIVEAGREDERLLIVVNDSDNARQFIDLYETQLRFVHDGNRWIRWRDGTGWGSTREGELMEIARAYVRKIEDSLFEMEEGDRRDALLKKSKSFGDYSRLNALVALAKSDGRVAVSLIMLDADPWFVGVQNGSLDLKTGQFLQPRREDLVTRRLMVSYDPDAKCPAWIKFLERIQPEEGMRRFLKASVGYTLTGHTREHRFWFLHGGGANGKGTFIETIAALFGSYMQGAPEKLLAIDKNGSQACHELARLPGIRLLIGSEVSESMKLNEPLLKGLTAGDTLTGEAKYEAPFEFKPQAKLWISGNSKPVISGSDNGIWRRVLLLPFEVTIPDSEKDGSLGERLLTELPGILNWALEGLADWRDNGLILPAEVKNATAAYRGDSDTLGEFVADHLDLNSQNCRLTSKEVYERFQTWAHEAGMRHPWSAKIFNQRLSERGPVMTRRNGQRVWLNIGWRPEC